MGFIPTVYAGEEIITDPKYGVATIAGLEPLFGNILAVIIEAAAIIFFIMLIFGGFRYITSSGAPKQVEAAKHTLTYAILGIVLTASAFFIIELVQQLTGAEITDFTILLI